MIDASLPLCRGRLISFNEGEEGWVSFRYERLPNICYWCGCLNHCDKDCDRWVESDGSLKDEDKEYGSWIRTTAAVLTKKSVVRVPGFYEARKKKPQPIGKGGGEVTSRIAAEHAEPSVSVETSKVVAETDFAEEFNVRIKIDEVKSAPTEKETPKPDLEGDSLGRNKKETDEELRRQGSNEGVISGDLSNLIKAQGVMVNLDSQLVEPASSLKECDSRTFVPPKIIGHVSSYVVSSGQNLRPKKWKRVCQEAIHENSTEKTVVPAKRNLVEKVDLTRGEQNKKKKVESRDEGATKDILAEAVSKPRQVQ